MLDHQTNNKEIYSEAQVTHWLSWLARGMQQHGQTIFLIEQLQPSWLPARCQRRLYVFCSSLLGSLMFGLIITLATSFGIGGEAAIEHNLSTVLTNGLQGLIFGTIFGVLLGVFLGLFKGALDWTWLDQKRLWMRVRKMTILWQTALHLILTGVIVILSYVLSLELAKAFIEWFDAYLNHAFVSIDLEQWKKMVYSIGGMVSVIAILLWGIRTPHRSLRNDIRTVESLSWSWTRAFKSAIRILGFALVAILIVILVIYLTRSNTSDSLAEVILKDKDNENRVLNIIILSLILALIRAAFAGLRSEIVEMKTAPNQGIRLSIQNALLGGGRFGLILGVGIAISIAIILFGFYKYFDFVMFQGVLVIGLLVGFSVGMFASTWYGGQDVVRHFILRYILYRNNYTPRHFVHFLDYTANELNFLQKVGGGYIFIHRYLLEHFAAMAEDARSMKMQA